MFKQKIVESWLSHYDYSDLCEEFDSRNYNNLQRLYVLPYFTKQYGHDSLNDFMVSDQSLVIKIMALFKDVVIEMFGADDEDRPNSSVEDNEAWSPENQENLAKHIIAKIKEKLPAPVAS